LADYFTPVPSPFTGRNPIFKALKFFLKGSAMTENLESAKPTWFELTDGDAPSAQVAKVNKTLPVMAVLVTGAVIASGAFFAHASESEGSPNVIPSTTINQVDNSNAATTGATNTATEISNTQTATPKNSGPVIASVNNNLQNPSQPGMKALGGNGHDDDDDDEDDDHDGRERGEHRDRDEH
jgi:hypothetical protein